MKKYLGLNQSNILKEARIYLLGDSEWLIYREQFNGVISMYQSFNEIYTVYCITRHI